MGLTALYIDYRLNDPVRPRAISPFFGVYLCPLLVKALGLRHVGISSLQTAFWKAAAIPGE
jgi:hypothetical protein